MSGLLLTLTSLALAAQALPSPQTVDPHAGHVMTPAPTSAPHDPHAGHDMGGTATTAPEDPPSAAAPSGPALSGPALSGPALSGPAHAADAIFGAEAMTASRRLLVVENGDIRTTAVVIDRLEAGFGDGPDAYVWDAHGWTGGDIHRFWWKSEGEGDPHGRLHEAELQALYSRAISPFWNLQAGVRQDIRPDGPDTTHAVLGLQGLAPYWLDIDAAAFLSARGDLTAKVEAEYDQRITQRLILQPRIQAALSARDIPERRIGAGLSSIQAGFRLRYEIRREFAPYLGVEWTHAFGSTADRIQAQGGDRDGAKVVVGLTGWF